MNDASSTMGGSHPNGCRCSMCMWRHMDAHQRWHWIIKAAVVVGIFLLGYLFGAHHSMMRRSGYQGQMMHGYSRMMHGGGFGGGGYGGNAGYGGYGQIQSMNGTDSGYGGLHFIHPTAGSQGAAAANAVMIPASTTATQ